MSCENRSPFVIISSPGIEGLAKSVQRKLAENGLYLEHHVVDVTTFKNGEVCCRIPETVRRQHVLFFHPLLLPTPNEAFMRMLITCDALERASVSSVSAIFPFMSYIRQDRKDKSRVPISARMIANLIETNRKVEHIITVDLHTEQAQGFFRIPLDNLSTMRLCAEYVRSVYGDRLKDVVVLSPDLGGAVRVRAFANTLGGLPVAICEKKRSAPNVAEMLSVNGEPVAGKHIVMFDDMIDTGGSANDAALSLVGPVHRAESALVMASHGLFSGDAVTKLADSPVRFVVTDTIPRVPEFYGQNPWLTVLSVDQLLADAIYQHTLVGGSVSKLSR